ncbi:class I SAM-dependent methyltransferase [Aromatoleum petrolei]|uniref:Methyltransferase domain-containing protein n=1 Tax=Aromatoleum petrolei TaxID=76116 RepID=A0ABX1MTD9_9RHOO|nr:class I SAM-dependent methyltransferase [Aromatoleum petrolei]NMF91023.1 methyltransferase domain-containing protein [Aromatoleum petrolei]QTQ35389.1 Methyltransferase family protein [Aromatoleum petrolei]
MSAALADTPKLVADEFTLLSHMLPLAGARVLDLGCGKAEMSWRMVDEGSAVLVVAVEADGIQHEANLSSAPVAGLCFERGGAEAIAHPDDSFDLVTMFKSLHHVPVALMDRALAEICRVLRPGGELYVSEPVFAGELNEVIRLFHDEEEVRAAAIAAMQRAVTAGLFVQVEERHFAAPVVFRDFADFEARMMHVTHSQFDLDAARVDRVRRRFMRSAGPDGARFERPMRINRLRRAG